jgi:glycerol dehydrogenase-like iron-containing ADH family enzyme
MSTHLLSPVRTVIGPGAWRKALPWIAELGHRAFVLGGEAALEVAAPVLQVLAACLDDVRIKTFRGECTDASIDSAAQAALGYDFILAVGGGKVIDTAKAAAVDNGIPCVTLPTSPATCAAYTPLSIVHTEGGAYVESRRLPRPVAVLVVDPNLMIDAPMRLLSSGCIDALARTWDTRLAVRVRIPTAMAGLSVSICNRYWDNILWKRSADAIDAHHKGQVTDAFTQVVEVCIIGAGLAGQLGARSFGRSFSHAMGYALSDHVDCSQVLHGEAVGLGILIQCALDPETEITLTDMLVYFEELGAPTRFSELGIHDVAGASGRMLALETYELLDHETSVPFSVTVEDIHRAMLAIEQRGKQ